MDEKGKFVLILAGNAREYARIVKERKLTNSFYWFNDETALGFKEGSNVIITESAKKKDNYIDHIRILKDRKFKVIEGCL